MQNIQKELRKLRGTYKKLLILVETNEVFALLGMLALRYAITLGPIALVQGLMGAQPFVVLILVSGLAYFFPHLKQHKSKSKNRQVVELGAMAGIILGAFLITGRV